MTMQASPGVNFEPMRRRFADRWLLFLAFCLLGYALAGRGFAYFGVPPLFIGEICLGLGLCAFILTRGWSRMMDVGAALAVVPLFALGLALLIPNLPKYKVDAARDAVIFGYALFALVVGALLVADPRRLPRLIGYYGKFMKIFLIGIPIVFFVYRFGRFFLPNWPWADVPIIHEKEGDVLVHLSGILAFWMSDRRRVGWFWVAMLTFDIALMGVVDRAGMLTFIAVMGLCVLIRPRQGAAWKTVTLIFAGMVLLWASQIDIPVPGGKGRTISFEGFSTSVQSMVGVGKSSGLEGTKEWRLQWWGKIVDYTIYGPYFWSGKGFGINLADDDGFQVQSDNSLRSPHSIHMSVLARMGVPGMALWLFMHFVWLFSVFDTYLRARRRGQQRWSGVMLFLFMYYLGFMINGSFDVFIEGPMGGIWFWTVYGTGVGALWIWRKCPEVLADSTLAAHESPGRAQLLPAAGRGRPGLPFRAGPAGIARA
jgi:hypothetical protein